MKKIALRGEDTDQSATEIARTQKELLPLPEICTLKLQDEQSYHEEPTTGAKVSMRDAKQLVELLCLTCSEVKIKI